jgi:hypothetical protein
MIEELRAYATTNENTAQTKLLDYLEALIPTVDELVVNEPLSGDLDLEVVEKCNFKNVNTIQFSAGHITSIRNIPKFIKHLVCSGNLLTHLNDLPSSIEILEIPDNAIHHIELATLVNLKRLNINGNKFEVLDNLPKSIESILCDNNQIRRINLANVTGLKTLYCSNNGLLHIENMPDSVTEFVMENNPLINIQYKTHNMFDKQHPHTTYKIEFTDAIRQYYKWKNEYETKTHSQKKRIYDRVKEKHGIKRAQKQAQQVVPVCILCKRPVGMHFKKNDNHLIGQCGDINRRCLDIKIYMGENISLLDLIDEYKYTEEFGKEEIIRIKYNTLFNYMTEAESITQFKNKLNIYNASIEMLKEFEDNYETIYFNREKNENLRKKRTELFDIQLKVRELYRQYNKEGNRDILKMAAQLHQKEFIPLIESMRHLKYDIVEMNIFDNIYTLVQRPVGLSHIDYTIGESAKVVTWNKYEGKDYNKPLVVQTKYKHEEDEEDEEDEDYLRYA